MWYVILYSEFSEEVINFIKMCFFSSENTLSVSKNTPNCSYCTLKYRMFPLSGTLIKQFFLNI